MREMEMRRTRGKWSLLDNSNKLSNFFCPELVQ